MKSKSEWSQRVSEVKELVKSKSQWSQSASEVKEESCHVEACVQEMLCFSVSENKIAREMLCFTIETAVRLREGGRCKTAVADMVAYGRLSSDRSAIGKRKR